MRKVILIGLVVTLGLSLMSTGTSLAQSDRGRNGTATTWLGVTVTETDDGVVITHVSTDSPAEAGGLLVDDVLVSIDDQAIKSAATLTELVQAHEPGDVIAVTVLRADSESTFDIELGTTSDRQRPDNTAMGTDPLFMAERVLRVELSAVDDGYQVLESRHVSGPSTDTEADTGADTDTDDVAALAVDDVITAVNGTPVTEVDWQTLLTELADRDTPTLTLTVLRDGEEMALEITSFGGFRDQRPMDDHGRPGRDNHGAPSDTSPDSDDAVGSEIL